MMKDVPVSSMDEPSAKQTAAWRYPEPYSCYYPAGFKKAGGFSACRKTGAPEFIVMELREHGGTE